MHLHSLIQNLSCPVAYPLELERIEVRQTHISAVFLAGAFVYKVKKPVDLGFVDFTTLEKRKHFCEEEVRLNRRLAPQVYLGVVPIARTPGGLKVEGEGEVVEWAVKMHRLPEQASLLEYSKQGKLNQQLLEALASRIASFHRQALPDARSVRWGAFEIQAHVIQDVLVQAGPRTGTTIHPEVLRRLTSRFEDHLARLRTCIEDRAVRGLVREGHGDLRLDHIYVFPDCEPPDNLVIIDCIEFNEQLRFIDPVADAAFLAMELAIAGWRRLAESFRYSYLQAMRDPEGEELFPLYMAYRSAVRGAVRGLQLADPEIDPTTATQTREGARAHWLFALAQLEAAGRKPCLLLVGGLPGTGKSTLARSLGEWAGFEVIRTDVVRKQLAAEAPDLGSIYTPEWSDRTYAECLRRAGQLLFEGKRVLVDATWREEGRRRTFLDAATRWGVESGMLLCHAGAETVRLRLELRAGDVSDAGWAVYQQLARQWEEPGDWSDQALRIVDTEGSIEDSVCAGRKALQELGFWPPVPSGSTRGGAGTSGSLRSP